MEYTYINFSNMPNKDFDGFHNRVADAAANITNDDAVKLLTVYKENIRKFHEYVENLGVTDAKSLARNTDANRIKAFVNFRNTVRTVRLSEDAAEAALGGEIWKRVGEFGAVSSLSQSARSGVIKNAVTETEALAAMDEYASAYLSSGLKSLLERLKAAETAYETADLSRSQNRADRLLESNTSMRDACIQSYTDLVCCARCCVAAKSDSACGKFLDKVGDIVKFARSLYISRSGRRAKGSGDSAKTTETLASSGSETPASSETTVPVVSESETPASSEPVNAEVSVNTETHATAEVAA